METNIEAKGDRPTQGAPAVEPSGPMGESYDPKTESSAVLPEGSSSTPALEKSSENPSGQEPALQSETTAEEEPVAPPKTEGEPGNEPSKNEGLGETGKEDTKAGINEGGQNEGQTDGPPKADPLPSGDIANSKSAQLLRNRFSTWREKTSENAQTLWNKKPAIQENAKALWMQAPTLPAVTRLAAMAGGPGTAKGQTDGTTVKSAEGVTTSDQQGSFSSPDSGFVSGSNICDDGDREVVTSSSNDNQAHSSSVATEPVEAPRVIVGAAVSKAAAAASVVAESVATNFRGRYSGKASDNTEQPPPEASGRPGRSSPESQTALILKSRVARHMQDILDGLADHEFAMLLGHGMLGVNLKQCYVKNHGVFVDFLVGGGQAQLSGVIRTGDLLVKLGDVDLRKGTIVEIPQTIATAKRPVVLILGTGTKVSVERVNFVDIAVAMMHRARAHHNNKRALKPLKSGSKEEEGKQQNAVLEPGTEQEADKPSAEGESPSNAAPKGGVGPESNTTSVEEGPTPHSVSSVAISADDTVHSFVTPPAATLAARKEFVGESALRCYDKFVVSTLCELSAIDSNFRAAVRNAFLMCAIDSRRLPFLSRHLSTEDNLSGENDNTGNMTPSTQLMLFLELSSFLDLYGVTPVSRLRDIASRIARKFFLPTKVDNRLQPPLFDFHNIVPDASLRHLEFVLGGNSGVIPRDVFFDFQKAVVDSLTGAPFLSFLASSECSRMRGYLRNTAPFVNLPLRSLFDGLVGDNKHPGAKNCFAYMLLFLLCQLEKEATGEHDFSEGENTRLLGAASGLCCVLYIRGTLIPTIEEARKNREIEKPTEGGMDCLRKVVKAFEYFWAVYIAPFGSALEMFTKSIETETSFNSLRVLLEQAGAAAIGNEKDPLESIKPVLDALLDSKLSDEARRLSDELLYDYSVNVHTKFREHKLHEWMCGELSKMHTSGDPTWSSKELPVLPQGCIKRLLRKAELPVGVSSHKPYKAQTDTSTKDQETNRSDHSFPNADYAVVFGTSVGDDLAAQMPIPGIEHSDIRRYACLSVALDREHDFDTFSDDPIPATFESYATAPQTKAKPFADAADAMRLSADGWEVSLVSFIIPNGESSSGDATESALFGVSLTFQQTPRNGEVQIDTGVRTQLAFPESLTGPSEEVHTPEKKSDTAEKEFVYDNDGEAINIGSFASPITFETPKKPRGGNEGNGEALSEMTRKVKVSIPTPTFNQRLQERSWVDRARNSDNPLTIGVALVSRRNVIIAMRDTLSRMLQDYSRKPESNSHKSKSSVVCGALVEMLGTFAYQDVENASLRCILEPYLRAASAPWLERPILDQQAVFETSALKQLTNCLTPTPLALLFVTALLEQKIVLSSSRRSVLHAASVALVSMLRPLKWSHLLVPLVPSALAHDLIQYPAPFIIGVPSDDPGNMNLLNSLPNDVTLVDLDVGRVILAPSFALDNEMVRGTADATMTARALRSQVLYLAQSLGSLFGTSLSRDTWCCDSPAFVQDRVVSENDPNTSLDKLRSLARGFVCELLEGATSCCYWLEEATQGFGTPSDEPTVLFDEDRFFHIKNIRANNRSRHLFHRESKVELAMSLDDFDLVVESFLRCQSMSSYISSRDRSEMIYY